MNSSSRMEEETLPFYEPEQFYPVKLGDLLDSKYRVLGKLGYGAYSTAWLCRNEDNKQRVAIKALTRASANPQDVLPREVRVYEYLSKLGSSHIGSAYIRSLYDTFHISNSSGIYPCLVHPPMHMSIDVLRRKARSGKLSEPLLKQVLISLLQALDFLHSEAKVMHCAKVRTDIKASNIMLTIDDDTILTRFEKGEQQHPARCKVVDATRTIYASRGLSNPIDGLWGQTVLCDLGEARIGESHTGNIQPNIYKAPEIWDIFEDKHMFDALDEDSLYSASHHVAEMVGYLGLPPLEFLQRSKENRTCKWLGRGGVSVPSISLDESEENLSGTDKALFLQFIQSMLRWVPEDRKSAKELLHDPWLNS
ncbi:kinase domain protein [Aspergillus californicus]